MKYRIAICDDEQNQIEYITSIVASWSAHEGHSCEIRTFASAEAFLFEYEEDKAYDILLLDVEMKNMNGIELAKRIRKDNNRAEIILNIFCSIFSSKLSLTAPTNIPCVKLDILLGGIKLSICVLIEIDLSFRLIVILWRFCNTFPKRSESVLAVSETT